MTSRPLHQIIDSILGIFPSESRSLQRRGGRQSENSGPVPLVPLDDRREAFLRGGRAYGQLALLRGNLPR